MGLEAKRMPFLNVSLYKVYSFLELDNFLICGPASFFANLDLEG